MIAKRAKKSASRSLVKTYCYIVDVKNRSALQGVDAGTKVGDIRFTNLASQDLDMALIEMEALQAINTRSKSDKNYHLIISFPIHEKPDAQILENIEHDLCASIGFSEHQRVSATHNDTDHLHLHILINKVHPETYNNIEPFYDYKTLMAECEVIEAKYGLTKTNHTSKNQTQASSQEIFNDEQSLISFVNENLKEKMKGATSWQGMHELLADHDLIIAKRGAGLVVKNSEGIAIKASSIAREFSFKKLTDHLGEFEEFNHEHRDRPADTAASLGNNRASGAGTDLGNAGISVTGNGHGRAGGRDAFGAFRMDEQGHRSLTNGQASLDTVRSLSGGDMVRQQSGSEMLLSGDEIRDIQQKRAEQFARLRWTRNRMGRNAAGLSYQNHKQPLASKQGSPLYSSYLVDRKNRQIMQRQIRATLQAESAKFYQQLQHWHEARSQIIKKSKLRSTERKLEWKKLANERQAFIQQFKKKQAQQRETIPKLLDWPQFLKQQALKGDELAVESLRKRAKDKFKLYDNQILGLPEKTFIYHSLKPEVRKNGSIVYQLRDGGSIVDREADLQVEQITQPAAFLALTMAKDKFGARPLEINGSDDFKNALIEAAVEHRLNVTFANQDMEKLRTRKMGELAKKPPQQSNQQDEVIKRGKSR